MTAGSLSSLAAAENDLKKRLSINQKQGTNNLVYYRSPHVGGGVPTFQPMGVGYLLWVGTPTPQPE